MVVLYPVNHNKNQDGLWFMVLVLNGSGVFGCFLRGWSWSGGVFCYRVKVMIKYIQVIFGGGFWMDDNKVAVLLENLMSQFRTFGEGLDGLREEVKQFREETNNRFEKLEIQNRLEHQQLMQMVKELDKEVQVEIKRVK